MLDSALTHPKERRLVLDCSQKAALGPPCPRGSTIAQAREGAGLQQPDKGRLPGLTDQATHQGKSKSSQRTEERKGNSSSDPVKPLRAPCVESPEEEVQVPCTQHPQGCPLQAYSCTAAQGHRPLAEAARWGSPWLPAATQ